MRPLAQHIATSDTIKRIGLGIILLGLGIFGLSKPSAISLFLSINISLLGLYLAFKKEEIVLYELGIFVGALGFITSIHWIGLFFGQKALGFSYPVPLHHDTFIVSLVFTAFLWAYSINVFLLKGKNTARQKSMSRKIIDEHILNHEGWIIFHPTDDVEKMDKGALLYIKKEEPKILQHKLGKVLAHTYRNGNTKETRKIGFVSEEKKDRYEVIGGPISLSPNIFHRGRYDEIHIFNVA